MNAPCHLGWSHRVTCGSAVFLWLKRDLWQFLPFKQQRQSNCESQSTGKCDTKPKLPVQEHIFLISVKHPWARSLQSQGWRVLSSAQVAHREEERMYSAVRAGLPHPGDLLLQVQPAGGQDWEGGRPLLQQPSQAQHEGEMHWRL